ncbi:hypothetical protein SDC9_134754 [bioreactor metagenome]|uniref:Uncharacterized protein n=1 Tax=bioreactor metagenome TaxID=1076179 RepID=A0A645DE02_9ZZZZ
MELSSEAHDPAFGVRTGQNLGAFRPRAGGGGFGVILVLDVVHPFRVSINEAEVGQRSGGFRIGVSAVSEGRPACGGLGRESVVSDAGLTAVTVVAEERHGARIVDSGMILDAPAGSFITGVGRTGAIGIDPVLRILVGPVKALSTPAVGEGTAVAVKPADSLGHW